MLLGINAVSPRCKSSSSLTLLRTAPSTCFFVRSNPPLNVTQWTVSEMPDQSIKRTFCEERKWLSMTGEGGCCCCTTGSQLNAATTTQLLICHFSKGLVWLLCCLPHKQCYYRSIFAVECTLRRERQQQASKQQRDKGEREAKTKMNRAVFLLTHTHTKDSSPREKWLWQGQVNCDHRSRNFQVFVCAEVELSPSPLLADCQLQKWRHPLL